jgi:hypothetical protein
MLCRCGNDEMLRLLSACNIRCQQMSAIQQGLALLAALARRAGELAQLFIKRIILRAYMLHCRRLIQMSEKIATQNTVQMSEKDATPNAASRLIRRALLKQAAHFFQIGQLVQRAQIKVVQ